MLTVSRVSKSYGARTLFEDLSLQVNRGDRIGLIGPNGAGKSTLFSLILGENSPDTGTVSLQRGCTLGFLPQESAPSGDETILELAMSSDDELAQAMATMREHPDLDSPENQEASARYAELDGHSLAAKAKKILSGLAFRDGDHAKPAKTMSGGWIMRAHLARLLVMEPDLLMLDEPTNHLDLESLGWFQNYLVNYSGAILAISHDRYFLNTVCGAIVDISRGSLRRYTGNYDRFLAQKKAEEEQYLAAYKNQLREIAHLEDFINRFRAKASKAAQAQERIKKLAKIERMAPPDNYEPAVRFRFPQPKRSGLKVMALEKVCQAYGDHVVYRDLNAEVERGQRIVLVGPNGSGKSTMLKILAGLVPIQSGERIEGHNASVGYFAQQRTETLNVKRTVLDEASSTPGDASEQTIRTVLGSFLFKGDDVFKPVGVLSGGEKSRLSLVKLLLNPPNLLLLDEPTTHLDMSSIDALIAALEPYEGTLVFVSHDVHFIRALAKNVWHINAGVLTTYAGDYDYYLEKTQASSERGGLVAPLGNYRPEESPDKSDVGAKMGMKEIREQRRLEAEQRKAAAKARRELEQRVKTLESEILTLETRQKEVVALLEQSPDSSSAWSLHKELAEISDQLEANNAEWAQAAEVLSD